MWEAQAPVEIRQPGPCSCLSRPSLVSPSHPSLQCGSTRSIHCLLVGQPLPSRWPLHGSTQREERFTRGRGGHRSSLLVQPSTKWSASATILHFVRPSQKTTLPSPCLARKAARDRLVEFQLSIGARVEALSGVLP